ncbi:N-acetylmuramoyl-L-alanine amidase CwlD [Clostridium cylindrosporum]|uniref:Germination-specific N-acetylmuramoyl-L-alanine amidase CwlD n=1 Tax=Clostridium cylindrosporum DSM 605 TaxID=1121307 RepID=A0A0J8DA62_CLOCY|nr:N-acetylmuramoyl-L-alanine amidase CwlD [Clostridium cylindrosporum]KMT21204.1 germination-specific N-acetylmuramoyl-L-alanine amidase CwlD [Clostridium cylindrosporum DSM 605]
MKKKLAIINAIIVSLIVALILILDISYLNTFTDKLFGLSAKGSKTIVIDAGHGGRDGGAVGKGGTLEKDINLLLAKKIKSYIEENGDNCIMIREVDEDLFGEIGSGKSKKQQDLKKRKDLIKEYNADLFISIHLNSFPNSKGAQVFYQKGDENGQVLAKTLQDALVKNLDPNNKRIEKESNTYYLLKNNDIPSVIVECGFLSNPSEENLLKDDSYQNKIATSVFYGIERYFELKK